MEKRIVLVDDHQIVRHGLKALVEDEPGFTVVGEAASADAGLRVVEEKRPDIVVVDLILGEGPDGIQLTRGIKTHNPELPVLMLSGRDESLFAERALLAGASGYLMKDEAIGTLLDAVKTVLAGRLWLSAAMWHTLLPEGVGAAEPSGAEPEQLRILTELARGNHTVLGIARVLDRRPSDVERAIARACEQLRLPSRAALMLYAQRFRGGAHPEPALSPAR